MVGCFKAMPTSCSTLYPMPHPGSRPRLELHVLDAIYKFIVFCHAEQGFLRSGITHMINVNEAGSFFVGLINCIKSTQ